ncbi:hypothetical protein HDU96_002127 [Phlyctochytrium bullatum]|nr:hypothetical protein HDU96_002127 [Phlyctochytrium bullatum]
MTLKETYQGLRPYFAYRDTDQITTPTAYPATKAKLFIPCKSSFEAFGSTFTLSTPLLSHDLPFKKTFISVGIKGTEASPSASIQRYPRQKPLVYAPTKGPRIIPDRIRERILQKPPQEDTTRRYHARKGKKKVSKADEPEELEEVVTHTEVTLLSAIGQPTIRNRRGVPLNAQPRLPTAVEVLVYNEIDVQRQRRHAGGKETQPDNVPVASAQVGEVETSEPNDTVETTATQKASGSETEEEKQFKQLRMIVAYYTTVLIATDYYFEELAKAIYLPKSLTSGKMDSESSAQLREVLGSLRGVSFLHVEGLYISLLYSLIDLPEKSVPANPESSEAEDKARVTLGCPPGFDRKAYNYSQVPGSSDTALQESLSVDQWKIWKELVDCGFALRFVWSRDNKKISLSKLVNNIRAILFPSTDTSVTSSESDGPTLKSTAPTSEPAAPTLEPEVPTLHSDAPTSEPPVCTSEALNSSSSLLREYWGYTLEIVAPNRAQQTERTRKSERIQIASKKRNVTVDDDDEDEDSNSKKFQKIPGVEKATKALLGSIQTVFVLQDRKFMTRFRNVFGDPSGCSLGSSLLEAVRKSVKEEIDGWGKQSKYSWTALMQHPMIFRLFPSEGEQAPLVKIDPKGTYEIQPVPLQVQVRDIVFHQLKQGKSIPVHHESHSITKESKDAKHATLTRADFKFGLLNGGVTFSASLSAMIRLQEDKFDRTWGTAKLVVNHKDEIVATIPFKLKQRSPTHR